jgi:purine-binding chemotaxis protein CheW
MENLNKMNSDKQYFLFISNKEIYAVEALEVVEIVEHQSLTKVPMMKNYVRGVTNVRGNIIPVIDLALRFNLPETVVCEKTSLAILKKEYNNKILQIAIIIDEVHEVDNISDKNIEPTPGFGTKLDKVFILSMAKYNDEYIPIINIDTLLDIDIISILSTSQPINKG